MRESVVRQGELPFTLAIHILVCDALIHPQDVRTVPVRSVIHLDSEARLAGQGVFDCAVESDRGLVNRERLRQFQSRVEGWNFQSGWVGLGDGNPAVWLSRWRGSSGLPVSGAIVVLGGVEVDRPIGAENRPGAIIKDGRCAEGDRAISPYRAQLEVLSGFKNAVLLDGRTHRGPPVLFSVTLLPV